MTCHSQGWLFPLLVFWAMDGYYLGLEKGFRCVYDRVRVLPDSEVDFSMHRLPTERGVAKWLAALFAVPTLFFHGSALTVVILVLFHVTCA